MAVTCNVMVPPTTNSVDVKAGDALLLEITPKIQQKRKALSRRDEVNAAANPRSQTRKRIPQRISR